VTLAGWREPVEPAREVVLVESLAERTAELERRGQAYLVLPGGLGTLAELFSVWAGRLGGLHDRPIVVLDPEDAYLSLWWAVAQRLNAGAVPMEALRRGLQITRTAVAASAELMVHANLPTRPGGLSS
jgi:predicted Rossmann-fold nucleotide-binding protein